MSTPKLRMVAGPNGSGKSTLLEYLRTRFSFPLGYCLNPDAIDEAILRSGQIDLGPWDIHVDATTLRNFTQIHPLGRDWPAGALSMEGNMLKVGSGPRPGYAASVICDFMRRQWLMGGQSFTFETVMSSRDKVDLLREAIGRGYRTYLYYICTNDVIINRERVAVRVQQGGHDVPAEKIGTRYERSLTLLSEAIGYSSRAYLFDNSARAHRLIAEFEDGRLVQVSEDLPGWFVTHVLNKRV